jgi:hypothetical protein
VVKQRFDPGPVSVLTGDKDLLVVEPGDYLRVISLNWSQSNLGIEASAWVQEQTPIPEYEPARILPYDGCIP